jgi:hypothetical protein
MKEVSMGNVLRAIGRHPFVTSMARSFDLLGTYNSRSRYTDVDPAVADANAFADDWQAIGTDLRAAIDEMESETQEHAVA